MLCSRLLESPFDYSMAFDQALKNVVAALPNRPAIESSDEAVCHTKKKKEIGEVLRIRTDVLLRLRR